MMNPKYRRPLNEKQLYVLEILYRFRYLTTRQLARLEGKSNTSVYSRLRILTEQGYIGRHYDGQHQMKGEYANYFLLRPGVKALQAHFGDSFSAKAGKNIYKDPMASNQFIEHNTALLNFYCSLKDIYNDTDFITRNELTLERFDYFIKPLPDAYVAIKNAHFFLDYFDPATMFFKITRRIKQYVEYYETGEWGVTGSCFPSVVLICANSADQKRLQKKLAFMAGEVALFVAAADKITTFDKNDEVFWSSDNKLASMQQIIDSSCDSQR